MVYVCLAATLEEDLGRRAGVSLVVGLSSVP